MYQIVKTGDTGIYAYLTDNHIVKVKMEQKFNQKVLEKNII